MHTRTAPIASMFIAASLMSGAAHAAISFSSSNANVIAGTQAGAYTPNATTDQKIDGVVDLTNYSKTVNASSAYLDSSATASAYAVMHMDFVAGVFSGAGSYNVSSSSSGSGASGSAESLVAMSVLVTTPHAYTLTMDVSQGSLNSFDLVHGGVPIMHQLDTTAGYSGQLNGIVDYGVVSVYASMRGASLNGWTDPEWGATSGNFSYTLTLTPVPEPETYAMMLAGLALVGSAARRRKASTEI